MRTWRSPSPKRFPDARNSGLLGNASKVSIRTRRPGTKQRCRSRRFQSLQQTRLFVELHNHPLGGLIPPWLSFFCFLNAELPVSFVTKAVCNKTPPLSCIY